jgi:hypothetical protein
MRQLIDGVLYIADLPTLIAWFAQNAPEHLAQDENGFVELHVVVGFARTPTVQSGTAALVYIRMTEAQAEEWAATPGVTILAQRPYGPGVQDALYTDLFADAEATALYDSVYSRAPYQVDDGEGGQITVTPPERFGQMA